MEKTVTPTSQVCAVHKTHVPKNLTIEWHHILPVAWQLKTSVPVADQPSPGPDTDGRGMLWDNRGVWLCPTGHRNVHHWIVRLMHAIADSKTDDTSIAVASVSPKRAPIEFGWGLLALTRYMEVHNALPVAPSTGAADLLYLASISEWGQV